MAGITEFEIDSQGCAKSAWLADDALMANDAVTSFVAHSEVKNQLEEVSMSAARKLLSSLILAVSLAGVSGCGSTATKSSTGEYIDDAAITTKVKSAILGEPGLSSAEISVETFKGVVQLSGFVKDPTHIPKAEHVARGVTGVKDVKNDLRAK